MREDKSAYLPLTLHNCEDYIAIVEFVPDNADIDGIWVRSSLSLGTFKAAWRWFLCSGMQRQMMPLVTDLAYGKTFPEFLIADTDCEFKLRLSPTADEMLVDAQLEFQYCYGHGESAPTAIRLSVAYAQARLPDVQSLLRHLSQFGH